MSALFSSAVQQLARSSTIINWETMFTLLQATSQPFKAMRGKTLLKVEKVSMAALCQVSLAVSWAGSMSATGKKARPRNNF
jgi:hypothetical protein